MTRDSALKGEVEVKGCYSAVFRSGTIYSYYDPSIWLLVIHLSQLVMMSTVLYSLHVVEIKKDRPRTHRLLIQGLLSQGSRPPALVFSRALKAGRGVGGCTVKKGKAQVCPAGACRHREAGGGLNRSGTSYTTGWWQLSSSALP